MYNRNYTALHMDISTPCLTFSYVRLTSSIVSIRWYMSSLPPSYRYYPPIRLYNPCYKTFLHLTFLPLYEQWIHSVHVIPLVVSVRFLCVFLQPQRLQSSEESEQTTRFITPRCISSAVSGFASVVALSFFIPSHPLVHPMLRMSLMLCRRLLFHVCFHRSRPWPCPGHSSPIFRILPFLFSLI